MNFSMTKVSLLKIGMKNNELIGLNEKVKGKENKDKKQKGQVYCLFQFVTWTTAALINPASFKVISKFSNVFGG